VGQKLAAAYPKEATAMMSTCIIAAQGVMLPIALALRLRIRSPRRDWPDALGEGQKSQSARGQTWGPGGLGENKVLVPE
jgi:hypothetical protein